MIDTYIGVFNVVTRRSFETLLAAASSINTITFTVVTAFRIHCVEQLNDMVKNISEVATKKLDAKECLTWRWLVRYGYIRYTAIGPHRFIFINLRNVAVK